MKPYSHHGFLFLSLVLLAFSLTGCATERLAGWERDDVAAEGDAAEMLQQAQSYWGQRHDAAHLEQAIRAYEKVIQMEPQNLNIFITLARAHYFWADAFLSDDVERQTAVYDAGLAYAEKAMALDPEFKRLVESGEQVEDAVSVLSEEYVGAIYWASASLGKWALNEGLPTMLANKERGRKMMERCLELDDTYFYGGPHRWFGSYYAKLPSIAGRDLEKSGEHFAKALEIEANYFGTRVLRAEYYATNMQEKEFYRNDLEFVLNTPSDVIPELVPEQDVEKRKAAAMLEAIEDRFL